MASPGSCVPGMLFQCCCRCVGPNPASAPPRVKTVLFMCVRQAGSLPTAYPVPLSGCGTATGTDSPCQVSGMVSSSAAKVQLPLALDFR